MASPPIRPAPPATTPANPAPASLTGASRQEAEARQQHGRELTSQGRFAQAVAELDESIRLDPKLATSWNARGYAWLRLRRYDRAIADFSEAIRLNPTYANAWHNRAVARKAQGDQAGSAADAQKAAALERQ